MLLSKKGAALLQVLLVAAVLAGISVLLLRTTLSRTSSSNQTRRAIKAKLQIEACMAEVNQFWGLKKPEIFVRDYKQCIFYCKEGAGNTDFTKDCDNSYKVKSYECFKDIDGMPKVEAVISGNDGDCEIKYTILDASAM